MNLRALLFVLVSFLMTNHFLYAQDAVIAVGDAQEEKDKIVIDDGEFVHLDNIQSNTVLEFLSIIKNDFSFYRHKFNVIELENKGKKNFSQPLLNEWKSKNIRFYVVSQFKSSKGGEISGSFRLWSLISNKVEFSEEVSLNKKNLRTEAHLLADKIYRAMTGKPSIFTSKIFFISDRTTVGSDVQKELYMMDFDGRRVDKLTHFKSIIFSPDISSDNKKIIFSLVSNHQKKIKSKVVNIKNIDLKILDLETKNVQTLSKRPGINAGAIFGKDDKVIYLTLTFSGNADIYELNLETKRLKKVTSHYGSDVDPSVNREGDMMTFLSNRSGKAHIFTMDPRETEKNVKRVSFVGKFNGSPRFSPDGSEIVFSSWIDNSFDLYRINSNGNNLSRLTKNFGSNEEPSYSPDGEFIIFSSKKFQGKKSSQNIFIMNRDGEILGQLTQNFGHCFSAKWTKLSK